MSNQNVTVESTSEKPIESNQQLYSKCDYIKANRQTKKNQSSPSSEKI